MTLQVWAPVYQQSAVSSRDKINTRSFTGKMGANPMMYQAVASFSHTLAWQLVEGVLSRIKSSLARVIMAPKCNLHAG